MTLDKRTMNESMYLLLNRFSDFPASHITFHGCTIPPQPNTSICCEDAGRKFPNIFSQIVGCFMMIYHGRLHQKQQNARSFLSKNPTLQPSIFPKHQEAAWQFQDADNRCWTSSYTFDNRIPQRIRDGCQRPTWRPLWKFVFVCAKKQHFQVDFFWRESLFIKIAF